MVVIMAIPVVEFSREGYKIEKGVWLKINCGQMRSLIFANWLNMEVSKCDLSKSTFYVKNHLKISDFFQ